MAQHTEEKRQAAQGEATTPTGTGDQQQGSSRQDGRQQDGSQQMAPAERRGQQMKMSTSQAGMDLDRPWSFRRVFDEFDRMFEQLQRHALGRELAGLDMGAGWSPRMEVQDTEREVVLTLELPGFEPDEVSIECTEDVLTIRGEHRSADTERGYQIERSFVRHLAVPAGCDVNRTEATFRHGLLTIHLPRAGEIARQIPISTDGSERSDQRSQSAEQRAA